MRKKSLKNNNMLLTYVALGIGLFACYQSNKNNDAIKKLEKEHGQMMK